MTISNLTMLEYLVEECGASLLSRDMLGRTPVMYAAISHFELGPIALKYIAGKLADEKFFQIELNHQDVHGKTALHHAVQHNNQGVVQFCAEHGADPDILDKTGRSVWDFGWALGHDPSLLLCTLFTRSIPSSLDLPLFFSGSQHPRESAPVQGLLPIRALLNISTTGSSNPVSTSDFDSLAWAHIPWTNVGQVIGTEIVN
jgi:hypothetical protein